MVGLITWSPYLQLLATGLTILHYTGDRACRLPSVIVRAGAPNAATTGAFSSVVREPLAGVSAISAIGPHVRHAVTGHRTAVASLLGAHELSAASVDQVLGFDRTVGTASLAQLRVCLP